jgi:hypothetical protein
MDQDALISQQKMTAETKVHLIVSQVGIDSHKHPN